MQNRRGVHRVGTRTGQEVRDPSRWGDRQRQSRWRPHGTQAMWHLPEAMKPSSPEKSIDDLEISLPEFIDCIEIGVFRSSIEGVLKIGNRALARIFGFASIDEMRAYPLIRLYRSKKDRGELIKELIRSGRVEDRHIEFRRPDGSHLWGAITARAVLDTDGNMMYMDGVLRDVTSEKEQRETLGKSAGLAPVGREFSFSLDGNGLIRAIDPAGAEIFGYGMTEMVGNPLSAYIAPKYRQQFGGFFDDLSKQKTVEGILIFNDREGKARHLDVHARPMVREGKPDRIDGIARDITRIVEIQQERVNQERFQGVLEMAGGVAHRLNQPLTVVTNLVNELMSDTPPEDKRYARLGQVQELVLKLNELTKKIGNIRKYKSIDYVAGVRIVDIDQAS